MIRRFALVLPLLALGACSEQEVLTYQGRPATTALECEAAFQGAKQRQNAAPVVYGGGVSPGAAIFGAMIGKSMVRGMTESHYNACLARVANQPAGTVAAPAPLQTARVVGVAPRPARTPGCHSGAGVLQGGAGYCIGN